MSLLEYLSSFLVRRVTRQDSITIFLFTSQKKKRKTKKKFFSLFWTCTMWLEMELFLEWMKRMKIKTWEFQRFGSFDCIYLSEEFIRDDWVRKIISLPWKALRSWKRQLGGPLKIKYCARVLNLCYQCEGFLYFADNKRKLLEIWKSPFDLYCFVWIGHVGKLDKEKRKPGGFRQKYWRQSCERLG